MHSIPIPHGLLPSRARYASECQAKVLIVFYPTKRSYKISACNLTIRTKTAIFSLQNDYYAKKCNDWLFLKMEGGVMSVAGWGQLVFQQGG
jgi:hypothetical protein